MAKSNERGPLLFVDTTYKGCRVTEQSFFKTPTQKPKDIVAENYVHSFDRLEESHFQALVPKEDDMQENTYEESVVESDDCPYETVNIVVNYHQEPAKVSEKSESTSCPVPKVEASEPQVEVEGVAVDSTEEMEEQVVEIVDQVVEESPSEVTLEDEGANDVQDSQDAVVELDEKQQELLTFIQELTNRPLLMKAPIVQIVKKDGSLKSGMIELKDDRHITIDNLKDEIEVISVAEIEGIRILHL